MHLSVRHWELTTDSIQFLFKVDTFGNVTSNISFKLLHRLNFRNNKKIIIII